MHKDWPGAHVVALICCRVGDPHYKDSPGSKVEQCYLCDTGVHVSSDSQREKRDRAERAEFICINCWSERYKQSTKYVFKNGKLLNPQAGH